MEPSVRASVSRIPLLKTKAGPRDGDKWTARLKEEYASLIAYVENNKASDSHWFQLESNPQGTRWYGTCWTYYKNEKYEFEMNFDIPVTYPQAPPEIALPQLEGKTVKMYRGGKICMTTHFFPLWARNVPYFGLSHALALGLGPWLSIEVPAIVEEGRLKPASAAALSTTAEHSK
ncbi:Ubiquitin-fold modifier-conjugating enzyme 1, putative [Leishmania lindenbergi]|uniref:Ubiquitin-fold modifier-conjugating enzyme 1 n=1 Tax=Leishmania lindenbergi TaxID=651832 RepID=A0AAW3AM54_9TRYP